MQFLQEKFFDQKGYVQKFLSGGNQLIRLEQPGRVSEEVKKDFVEQFIAKIIDQGVIERSTIQAVRDKYSENSWSIDFPGWIGEFNEEKGKKVMIIGSEPHVHYRYLQTVYGFNNDKRAQDYIANDHPIFKYLSDVLAQRFQMPREDVLKECYLTDLFPLGPFRGNGVAVGSVDKIQALLGESGNWIQTRSAYAKDSLPKEIAGVKPQLIITQGVTVFLEVLNILGIINGLSVIPIFSSSGKKRQYVRKVEWNGIPIVSVPHIGSGRMRTFWNNNLEAVKQAVAEI